MYGLKLELIIIIPHKNMTRCHKKIELRSCSQISVAFSRIPADLLSSLMTFWSHVENVVDVWEGKQMKRCQTSPEFWRFVKIFIFNFSPHSSCSVKSKISRFNLQQWGVYICGKDCISFKIISQLTFFFVSHSFSRRSCVCRKHYMNSNKSP